MLADAQSREGDVDAACDTLRRVIRMLDRRGAPRDGSGAPPAPEASAVAFDAGDEERPERLLAIAHARLATLTTSASRRA